MGLLLIMLSFPLVFLTLMAYRISKESKLEDYQSALETSYKLESELKNKEPLSEDSKQLLKLFKGVK